MKSWLGLTVLAVAGSALAAPGAASLVDLAMSDQAQAALALIDQGADVNATSDDGSTALLLAKGQPPAIRTRPSPSSVAV